MKYIFRPEVTFHKHQETFWTDDVIMILESHGNKIESGEQLVNTEYDWRLFEVEKMFCLNEFTSHKLVGGSHSL